MRRLALVTVIVASASWLACAGGESVNASSLQDDASPSPLLLVVFDPTVLDPEDEEEFQQMVGNLSGILDDGFEHGGRLVVFDVHREMIHALPVLDDEIELIQKFHRKEDRDRKIADLSEGFRSHLELAWDQAHLDDERRKLNSCIYSSLHRAGEYRSSVSEHSPAWLIVVSDLLEACDDSGAVVNFERSLEAPTSWTTEDAPRLGAYDLVWVIQIRNDHLKTRPLDRELHHIWCELLERSGLELDKLSLQREIPGSVGTATKLTGGLCRSDGAS